MEQKLLGNSKTAYYDHFRKNKTILGLLFCHCEDMLLFSVYSTDRVLDCWSDGMKESHLWFGEESFLSPHIS